MWNWASVYCTVWLLLTLGVQRGIRAAQVSLRQQMNERPHSVWESYCLISFSVCLSDLLLFKPFLFFIPASAPTNVSHSGSLPWIGKDFSKKKNNSTLTSTEVNQKVKRKKKLFFYCFRLFHFCKVGSHLDINIALFWANYIHRQNYSSWYQ